MGVTSTLIVAAVFIFGALTLRELRLKYKWTREFFTVNDQQIERDEFRTSNPSTTRLTAPLTTTATPMPSAGVSTISAISAISDSKSDIAVLIAPTGGGAYDANQIAVAAARARQRIGNRPDVYLMVASDAPDDAELARLGIRLWRAAMPQLAVEQQQQQQRELGDEFRKLSAFLMRPYRRVVVIEPRVLLHRSLGDLLSLPPWVELVFARGVAVPFQTAIFIVTPSPDVYALLEHARGFPVDEGAAPDFGRFVSWFFGHKRPLRASVPVSDCHYANTEEPFCSDTPSEQLSAFIFSDDRCPMTHCIANNVPSSGQLCRFARSEYLVTFAELVANAEDLCQRQ